MILQALCSYYRRASAMAEEEQIRPGYAMLGVGGELVIDRAGNLVAANPRSQQSGKKQVPLQMIVPLPPKRSGQKPEPAFLYETISFLFGIFPKPEGAQYRFEASRTLHQEVLENCADEGAKALLAFFEKRKLGNITYEGADTSLLEDPRVFVVFRLQGDGQFLHERPAIQAAWQTHLAQKSAESLLGQCMVTGKTAPIARVHGNVGGFGADKPTLIGFNQDAFCSFGKYGQQGKNAPVSEQAAFEYVTALNMLCKDANHYVNLAGDKVVFWAEKDAPAEENILSCLLGGENRIEQLDVDQRDRVKGVLDSLYKGGNLEDFHLDPNVRFFILGLAANKTRLVIRFFYENSFGSLLSNLEKHYQDIGIDGMRYAYPAPYHLLMETAALGKRENVPSSLESALMRSILDDTPYPLTLFQGVLRRVRAEGEANALRAGILKGTINRQAGKEVLKMGWNTNETDLAYLLGGLLAMLERTQQIALGDDLNSTITDKYLNAALATPRMVFPTLIALHEKHLKKSADETWRIRALRDMRDNVDELLHCIDPVENAKGKFVFPESMDSNDQGKFLVGYHHKMYEYRKEERERIAKAIENRNAKKSAEASKNIQSGGMTDV